MDSFASGAISATQRKDNRPVLDGFHPQRIEKLTGLLRVHHRINPVSQHSARRCKRNAHTQVRSAIPPVNRLNRLTVADKHCVRIRCRSIIVRHHPTRYAKQAVGRQVGSRLLIERFDGRQEIHLYSTIPFTRPSRLCRQLSHRHGLDLVVYRRRELLDQPFTRPQWLCPGFQVERLPEAWRCRFVGRSTPGYRDCHHRENKDIRNDPAHVSPSRVRGGPGPTTGCGGRRRCGWARRLRRGWCR